MGTRSRVNIVDGNQVLVSIYRQFDGYPSGMGIELKRHFGQFNIVNGISGDDNKQTANGMGCFAAQVIATLKKTIGNVYIRDTSNDSHGEEFSYSLSNREGKLWLDLLKGPMTMFGSPGAEEREMTIIYSGLLGNFVPEIVKD